MWVKICGIKDLSTAQHVARLAPNALGLNFYAQSPRYVAPEIARQITDVLPKSIAAFGLFVNHSLDEIANLVAITNVSLLQIHGDESPAFLAELQQRLPAIPLIRAWRMGPNLADLQDYLAECQQRRVRLAGCLIDAKVPGSYGGTGQTPPWDVLRQTYQRADWPPLILAGGLTEANVAQGIAAVKPWGVDVASGVEAAPGVKDLTRVAQFLAAARGSSPSN